MRKSKANEEEEWTPGSLKKMENRSTEKLILPCSNRNENLTRLQSYESWKVLLAAAKIWKHQAVLETALTLTGLYSFDIK